MKILHVIDSGGLYGAEVMLLNLMEEQHRLGLVPVLASIGEHGISEKPLEAEARRCGLRVEPFRMRPGLNIAGAFNLIRFSHREGVDILHSHGYKGNILFGLMPRRLRCLPMVATVHGWTWTGGLTRRMMYEWLDSLSLTRLDRVVLVNGVMKNHARLRNRQGLAVEVIHNGIPADNALEERTQLNMEIVDFCRQGYTIGAVGRLSPEKGFDLLLEAVAGLIADAKDVRLVVLGEGGLRGELEERAGKLGLEGRVLFPGYVRNARDYLHLFGILAIPSLTEGLPIVLLEAMQAGVPIVASRVGGMPEVLAFGRAGLLIEPGSVESVKLAVSEVLRDPAAAQRRAREAGKRVREEFSSRKMAEKYLEIYRNVVQ